MMADVFVLEMLSRTRLIAGRAYRVVWDRDIQRAKVIVKRDPHAEWIALAKTFPDEFQAHGYISELASLDQRERIDWRQYL